jgi:transposase
VTYSLDLRERAVAFVKGGGTQAAAARMFSVHPKTVAAWLRRSDLRPTRVYTRKRKIDKDALLHDLRENEHILLRERAKKFDVHIRSMSRALSKPGVFKKRAQVQGKKHYGKSTVSRRSPPGCCSV